MSALDAAADLYAALARKGLAATATLTRTTSGAYDPESGTSLPGTVAACDTLATLDSSSIQALGFKFGNGLVRTGDLMATIPAKGLAFEPLALDGLTLPMGVFTVVDVRPTYAGATPVTYALLVRR